MRLLNHKEIIMNRNSEQPNPEAAFFQGKSLDAQEKEDAANKAKLDAEAERGFFEGDESVVNRRETLDEAEARLANEVASETDNLEEMEKIREAASKNPIDFDVSEESRLEEAA